MTSTSLISRLLLALALAGLFGCTQEEGETCYEDDDCSGALVCCKPEPGVNERGTCREDRLVCMDEPPVLMDLGPLEDLGSADLGSGDLGPEPDMGESDAGEAEDMGGADDLGTDGGPDDMGGEPDLGDEDMG